MSNNKPVEAYEATLPEEFEALRKSWGDSALAHHARQLKIFAAEQREIIVAAANGSSDPAALITAMKRMVVNLGTVHHPSEMRDQMCEIHNYLWYRGENGDYDRGRIVLDWAACHAGNWRRWRLKQYLYVIDRIADELISRLRE